MRSGERSNPPPVTRRADASSVGPAQPPSSPSVSLGTRQLVTFLRAKSAKNGYCWWKQETIAEAMERGLRTVNRQIAEAVAAGLLRSERHGHGNYYMPCDLVGKVAHRDVAVEKPVHSAAAGVSDTPNWRIAQPPVSITEILKPEKKNQSECTVQEHQEPAGAATDPSPYEKAQTDAIAHTVRACGFEPTPDLMAKFDRKRDHYGVTGFVMASKINTAFKLVEGTSNHPRTLAWFTTVVENALKQHTVGRAVPIRTGEPEQAHHHASQTPIPDHVAEVGQASSAAVENSRAAEPSPISPLPEVCRRCGSDGVVNGATPVVWCDCERGRQKRRARPDYVDRLNRSGWRSSPTTAAVNPIPPQSELRVASEVLPAAMRRTLMRA
jgi:hypothetical protein